MENVEEINNVRFDFFDGVISRIKKIGAKIKEKSVYKKKARLYKKLSSKIKDYDQCEIDLEISRLSVSQSKMRVTRLCDRIERLEKSLFAKKFDNLKYFEGELHKLRDAKDEEFIELSKLKSEVDRFTYNLKVYKKRIKTIQKQIDEH